MMSMAAKCSLVWGWGHGSLPATSNRQASMTAAPLSIVAIKMSCPGQSTKLMCLWSDICVLQCSHCALLSSADPKAWKHCGGGHVGHWNILQFAYPSFMVMFRTRSFECWRVSLPLSAWTTVDFPWATCPIVPMLIVACLAITSGVRGVSCLISKV